MFRAQAKDA